MPSITKRSIDRARSSRSEGAGGEPPGEPLATPSEILDDVSDDLRGKLPDDVVDELLAGARTEEEIVGPGGLLSQLTKRLVERALEVEITDHVGYERHQEPPGGSGNPRNGSIPKRLITEHGEVSIDSRGIVTAALSRRSSASVSGALRALTTRSSPCIPAGCRRGISRRTSPRSTACTLDGT
jgi:hypothetical protein